MKLKDKVAIITGASRGIGKATAKLFMQEGANLVLTACKNMKLLREFVVDQNSRAVLIKVDLANREDINHLIEETFKKFGKIDILVNNAAVFKREAFEDISRSQFRKVMDIDLEGPFFLIQKVLKHFKDQRYGKVINVSSVSGKIGSSSAVHYAVAKAGLIALTKSLARIYGPFGINVNAVVPSLIDTDMVKLIPKNYLDKLKKAIPLKRLGLPYEVANLILFLANDDSSYITGQTINVDGGATM